MNKGSEISGLIDEQKPHVLALTEFGAGSGVSDGELGVDGYTLYRGDHSSGAGGLGKGVAMYVANTLNHLACPKFDDVAFDCSTWVTVRLSNRKTLLIGVVYRSPNSREENNGKLLALMRLAATGGCDYVTICGDFNLPKINWRASHPMTGLGGVVQSGLPRYDRGSEPIPTRNKPNEIQRRTTFMS